MAAQTSLPRKLPLPGTFAQEERDAKARGRHSAQNDAVILLAADPGLSANAWLAYLGDSTFMPEGAASVSLYAMPSDGMQNVSGNSCAFIQ
jgi:hypothetical protein